MMRRCALRLGGLVEYHEWQLHEPLLINYDGWRILDNPKYDSKAFAWTEDATGTVRHLDPIIDDPRLTHKQRVCRLYRWALKELQSSLVVTGGARFNIVYKVVRNRFEKYRYVTDAAMCDMMVRESQKYLRDIASTIALRRNPSSPMANYTLALPMFHPDNASVYDHFVDPEVYYYDDAKAHRLYSHTPILTESDNSERYGNHQDPTPGFYAITVVLTLAAFFWFGPIHMMGLNTRDDAYDFMADPKYDHNMKAVMMAEERNSRSRDATQLVQDWSFVLGNVTDKSKQHNNIR